MHHGSPVSIKTPKIQKNSNTRSTSGLGSTTRGIIPYSNHTNTFSDDSIIDPELWGFHIHFYPEIRIVSTYLSRYPPPPLPLHTTHEDKQEDEEGDQDVFDEEHHHNKEGEQNNVGQKAIIHLMRNE